MNTYHFDCFEVMEMYLDQRLRIMGDSSRVERQLVSMLKSLYDPNNKETPDEVMGRFEELVDSLVGN